MSASDPETAPSRRPPGPMPLAVAGSAVLALAAGGLFYYATQIATAPERETAHTVTVGERTCDPADLTVPAGRATFEIVNASRRPIEWEILDGVMVVEERENIAPGFRSLLTARLKPGTYEVTCGLLSNPRGTLVVTPSAQSEAARTQPPIAAFIGPLSEYKVFLATQSTALVRASEDLATAIRNGDIEAAKALYLAARLPYKRLEAVTGRIADLKNVIDPLPDYLEKREADPGFTGFHRIEYALYAQGSLDGLAAIAEKLAADVSALKERMRALRLAPEDLAGMAEREARRLGEGQISAGENAYAFTDLPELEASLDGMEKGVTLLRPLVSDAAPSVAARIEDGFAAARAELTAWKGPQGYPAFDTLDAQARETLAARFRELADAISALNPAIGLG